MSFIFIGLIEILEVRILINSRSFFLSTVHLYSERFFLQFKLKIEILEEITRVLFNQKRKKIRSKLKYFGEPDFLCQKIGIDPSIRAEEIPIEKYEKLAIEISNSQHQ